MRGNVLRYVENSRRRCSGEAASVSVSGEIDESRVKQKVSERPERGRISGQGCSDPPDSLRQRFSRGVERDSNGGDENRPDERIVKLFKRSYCCQESARRRRGLDFYCSRAECEILDAVQRSSPGVESGRRRQSRQQADWPRTSSSPTRPTSASGPRHPSVSLRMKSCQARILARKSRSRVASSRAWQIAESRDDVPRHHREQIQPAGAVATERDPHTTCALQLRAPPCSPRTRVPAEGLQGGAHLSRRSRPAVPPHSRESVARQEAREGLPTAM